MQIPPIGLPHMLTVGALLFGAGLYAMIARRDGLFVLIGTELMLLAAPVDMVAFSRFGTGGPAHVLTGQAGAILGAVLAACHAVVSVAIVRALRRRFATTNLEEADALRD